MRIVPKECRHQHSPSPMAYPTKPKLGSATNELRRQFRIVKPYWVFVHCFHPKMRRDLTDTTDLALQIYNRRLHGRLDLQVSLLLRSQERKRRRARLK